MSWPVPPQPDVEAFVWAQIGHLDGVTSFSVAAVPMPLVPWQVAHTLQVDARAGGKRLAWERAEAVRRILWNLGQLPWAEGVVSYVQIVEGPVWLPDDDGQPRYMLRVDIRVHPARQAGPAPLVGATAPGRPDG
jgi:hypothetical protein